MDPSVGVFHEPMLRVLLGLLLLDADDLLPDGSVLDAGAHLGGDACFYSAASPHSAKHSARIVHALDPDERNVAFMAARARRGAVWDSIGVRTVQPLLMYS